MPIECDATGRKSPQQDRSHKLWREANGGAKCGKSARCVRRGGDWKRGMVEIVGHSQTKGRDNGEPKLRPKPARQSSTLPISGMWKRSHGGTIEAPPNERGGNRYVLPNATAPHLDSTKSRKGLCEHKVSAVHPTTDIRRLAATFVARVAYHARSGRPVGPPASGKPSPISTRRRLFSCRAGGLGAHTDGFPSHARADMP